ncbi:unnamed protein product [Prorocentrum cordatum]|uniref:Uncharacterized protein n=1 Tax=Prorocentrum cordatum TaxID=2364126 RepID=A0ABN9QEP0_9DINO|nr:unnamed protein product [Polarella glacialis]
MPCRSHAFPPRSSVLPPRGWRPSEAQLCGSLSQRPTRPIPSSTCLPGAMGWGGYRKPQRPACSSGGNGGKGNGKDSWTWSALQEQREANRRYAEKEQQREAEEQRESLLAEVAHTTKNTVKSIFGMGKSRKVKKEKKYKKEKKDRTPSFRWTRALGRSLKRNESSSSSGPTSSSASSSASRSPAGFIKYAMRAFRKRIGKEKDRRKRDDPRDELLASLLARQNKLTKGDIGLIKDLLNHPSRGAASDSAGPAGTAQGSAAGRKRLKSPDPAAPPHPDAERKRIHDEIKVCPEADATDWPSDHAGWAAKCADATGHTMLNAVSKAVNLSTSGAISKVDKVQNFIKYLES